jgi:DNA repair protein RadC
VLSNNYEGHRKRLRERFLKSGLEGFQDYEIIELLLSLGTPRRDCKPQAKEAIRRFKNLRGVLEAKPEELQQISGIGPHSIFGIKFMHAVAREFLKERMQEKPIYSSSQEIFDYFYHSMRDLKKEVVKVIYLNSNNQIIDVIDYPQGTVDSSFVYPREIIEGALKHCAVSIILVHNHPSGNPEPSLNDKIITRNLVFACNMLDIKLLDHIIIGDNCYFSLAADGWIDKCDTQFRNLGGFNN